MKYYVGTLVRNSETKNTKGIPQKAITRFIDKLQTADKQFEWSGKIYYTNGLQEKVVHCFESHEKLKKFQDFVKKNSLRKGNIDGSKYIPVDTLDSHAEDVSLQFFEPLEEKDSAKKFDNEITHEQFDIILERIEKLRRDTQKDYMHIHEDLLKEIREVKDLHGYASDKSLKQLITAKLKEAAFSMVAETGIKEAGNVFIQALKEAPELMDNIGELL